MKVTVERLEGGIIIVAVSGEVDKNTSPGLRSALLPLFDEGPKALLVELAGVSYIDSSGIATLTEGFQLSHRRDITFRLAGMDSSIKDVFELARLGRLFEIFDSREEALEGLS